MHVSIDGVDYVPASSGAAPRLAICITTRDRAEVLADSLEHHLKHLPAGALLCVVDDGSKVPAVVPSGVHLIRHEKSRGIPAAKNACLEWAMDAGAEHIALWDDDAYPIADGWEAPYLASPEAHLSYQFLDLSGPKKLHDMAVVYSDGSHVAYTGQRGVMLWFRRDAIEAVGGFDAEAYGRGMYEHSDLAMRIHSRGLTTLPFMDVVGSSELIYSLDEHGEVNRSVPTAERQQLVAANVKVHNERREEWYDGWAPYRTPRRVVLTTLLTHTKDPQRAGHMAGGYAPLRTWAESIRGGEAVVLADHEITAPDTLTVERVPGVDANPYYRRWLLVYQYLREHPEVSEVWVTDGTDVEMLHEPWSEMKPGTVYVGSEPKIYDDEWAWKNHRGKVFSAFLDKHRRHPMINAGLLGGSRADVMAFAHKMVHVWADAASQRFWGTDSAPAEIGDMVAFGIVALEHFADRIETGPGVHTVFRAEERNPYSWWRHK